MRATNLFLLLAIAALMACEPGASTCLYEEPSTAEEYTNADEPMDDSTAPIEQSDEPDPEPIDESKPETADEFVPEADDEPDPESIDESKPETADEFDPETDDALEWDPMEEDASDATEAPADSPEADAALDCDLDNAWLTVPVVAHQLFGTNLPMQLFDVQPGVDEHLDLVNALWAQACIRFVNVGFQETTAIAAAQSCMVGCNDDEAIEILSSLIAPVDVNYPEWKLFLYGEFFPNFGSGYYSWEIGAVFLATGVLPSGFNYNPIILAHQLGHSLGLTDYDGPDAETNIMGLPDSCEIVGNRLKVEHGGSVALQMFIELTPEQIAIARAQAATGVPFWQHQDAWK